MSKGRPLVGREAVGEIHGASHHSSEQNYLVMIGDKSRGASSFCQTAFMRHSFASSPRAFLPPSEDA